MPRSIRRSLSLLVVFTLLLTTAPLSFAAEDISGKFTDARFLAYVRELLGKPTGPIYAEDCAKVEEIDISRRIISLNGLQYFTGATSINVSSSSFTLDLSKNVSVEYLSISMNYLTTLDLSKNINLIGLSCSGTKLTKLDLSKNTKLETLYCYNNYFPNASAVILPKTDHIVRATHMENGEFAPWRFIADRQKQGTPPENPSEWALPYIIKAETLGAEKGMSGSFSPRHFAESYKGATTREEFAGLIGSILQLFSGNKNINEELDFDLVWFDDVGSNWAVAEVAGIGIIEGIGNNKFNPTGQLTRAHAATILSRTLSVLHLNVSDEIIAWTDTAVIPDWAINHTHLIYNSGLMNGTSTTALTFSPNTAYTHEQTLAVIVRLYDYATENGARLW